MSSFSTLESKGVEKFFQQIERKNGLWLFHHIPKTAGTSLTHELKFLLSPYYNIYANGDDRETTNHDPLTSATTRFIKAYPDAQYRSASGHLRLRHLRSIIEQVPHVRMFTFLRDPVKRVVSEYRYTRTPKHPTYKTYLEKYNSIDDYVEDPANQDKMWSFVAPRDSDPDDVRMKQVFNRYAFIGTLENFDRDYGFFAGLNGCPKTPQARSNTTAPATDNAVEMTDELHAKILRLNSKDAAFYNDVVRVLDANAADIEAFIETRRHAYAM